MHKQQYLQAMGIEVWREKDNAANKHPHPSLLPHTGEGMKREKFLSDEGEFDWQKLQTEAENCVACGLCKTRTHVVFGVGNRQADLLIVGEAPGANEDKQGEPFVGRAGQLLNNMLRAIGLARSDIYIANILKCRPPNNRDPKPEEVALCTPFLERQIALLQPKIILAVGRIAAHFLLGSTEPMARLRGREYQYQQVPLLITYHPAYLLRSPLEKRKAFEDLLLLKKYLPS